MSPGQHRILILFTHPALQKSRVNQVLLRVVRDLGQPAHGGSA